ncbi:MAG: serine/threonine protein kinase involved in cell cycle control [halophilic archaeon J07HX5]|jgi:Serine/threonine protein kinase involved in cell cycle control|nr:MAG: serine/threonine protein kinase involved in cell cycle control [halophilic archaeon J07HX5]
MEDDYGLLETDQAQPGDEWTAIDYTDTEADQIARERDREFSQFRDRITDADQFKLKESVFDEATYGALYKLVQDGQIAAFGGPVSTGKEANVYTAIGGAAAREALNESAEPTVAVKLYRINASDFREMGVYLEGDPRFDEIANDKKAIVVGWVRKEFANLQRALAAGVRVPRPLAVERNALVMEYLGTNTGRAKRLAEVHIENPATAYEVVREYMRRLYDAGMVHGDLSEYNIVVDESELYLIDVGQAVTVHHPNSDQFFERDCENVASFFSRQGADVTPAELSAYVREHADPTPV